MLNHTLLTTDELAARLRCHRNTLRSWQARGLIPGPIRIGRNLRWPESAVDELLRQQTANGGGELVQQ